jgi:hypothetical protein
VRVSVKRRLVGFPGGISPLTSANTLHERDGKVARGALDPGEELTTTRDLISTTQTPRSRFSALAGGRGRSGQCGASRRVGRG